MRYYYTYKVQCTAVGWEDYYYLGKHVTSNLNDGYKGSGKRLQEYYKQYPEDYTFTILAFYKDKTELSIAEQKLIGDLWKTDPYCLNANAGGNGSWLAAGASNKGKSPWNKGKVFSDEAKQKMSESRKGKAPSNKGIPMTEEQKHKISATKRGKISKRKGIPMTEEQKHKISATKRGKRRVYREDGTYYMSAE